MKYSDTLDAFRALDWRQFESFLCDVLRSLGRFTDIRQNIQIDYRQVDLVAMENDPLSGAPTYWYFEAKARAQRVGVQVVQELVAHKSATRMSPSPKFVLATTSPLSRQGLALAQHSGIEVWDPAKLIEIAPAPVLQEYLGGGFGEVEEDRATVHKGDALRAALDSIEPGRKHWSDYQRLSSEILEFLFSPPLDPPLDEVRDSESRNRRDIILANSAADGFWAHIRNIYDAHYIVVDAKNYVEPLKKNPVVSVADYLKPHGCGMFGLVMSRKGAGSAADHAIREQWIAARKMILVLNDDEVKEMIRLKVEAGDPEELIRRKITRFRISL